MPSIHNTVTHSGLRIHRFLHESQTIAMSSSGATTFCFAGDSNDEFTMSLADVKDIKTLQQLIARQYGVVEPEGIPEARL